MSKSATVIRSLQETAQGRSSSTGHSFWMHGPRRQQVSVCMSGPVCWGASLQGCTDNTVCGQSGTTSCTGGTHFGAFRSCCGMFCCCVVAVADIPAFRQHARPWLPASNSDTRDESRKREYCGLAVLCFAFCCPRCGWPGQVSRS
jgi:hypothetical protein